MVFSLNLSNKIHILLLNMLTSIDCIQTKTHRWSAQSPPFKHTLARWHTETQCINCIYRKHICISNIHVIWSCFCISFHPFNPHIHCLFLCRLTGCMGTFFPIQNQIKWEYKPMDKHTNIIALLSLILYILRRRLYELQCASSIKATQLFNHHVKYTLHIQVENLSQHPERIGFKNVKVSVKSY